MNAFQHSEEAVQWLLERWGVRNPDPLGDQAVRNFRNLIEAAKQGREAFHEKFAEVFSQPMYGAVSPDKPAS